MCCPHPTSHPCHFFARCPGCKALWKLDVDQSGAVVGAPDPPWYDSFSQLGTRATPLATELQGVLREAAEGFHTGRERSAAAALRLAVELYLFGEVLGMNLNKRAPPDWGDARKDLKQKLGASDRGREILRNLLPHLDEVYEVGLTGVHARPRKGVKPAGTARIGAAFREFDELLKLSTEAHAEAAS